MGRDHGTVGHASQRPGQHRAIAGGRHLQPDQAPDHRLGRGQGAQFGIAGLVAVQRAGGAAGQALVSEPAQGIDAAPTETMRST